MYLGVEYWVIWLLLYLTFWGNIKLFQSGCTIVFTLMFRSVFHFELISCTILYDTRAKVLFFPHMAIQLFSNLCWKEYPFPIEITWHYCWKSIEHVCTFLFLYSYSVLLIICLSTSVFTSFWGCPLFSVFSLENGSYSSGSFVQWVILDCILNIVSVTWCKPWVLGYSSEDCWCLCLPGN